jgi:hypothetical protein
VTDYDSDKWQICLLFREVAPHKKQLSHINKNLVLHQKGLDTKTDRPTDRRRNVALRIDSWGNELVVRQSPAGIDVNTEGEDSTLMRAVT